MKAHKRRFLFIYLPVLLIFLAILTGLFFNWQKNFRDKIYPGVSVGNLKLEKLTFSEAEEKIKSQAKKLEESGFKIQNDGKIINVSTEIFSFDSDLSSPTLYFDYLATTQAAYGENSDRTFIKYLLTLFKKTSNLKVKMIYNLDEIKIKDLLDNSLSELNIQAANAYFTFNKKGQIEIIPEKLGKEINYKQAISDLKNNLDNLDASVINIKTQTKYPEITASELISLDGDIKTIIGTENLVLFFQDTQSGATSSEELLWNIKPEKIITWFSVSKVNGETIFSLDLEKVKSYLELNVSKELYVEAIMPRFEIKNNKVNSWQRGKLGRELDLEGSAKLINEKFFQNERKILLITKTAGEDNPSVTSDLNLNEILGTGFSDFTGSPANRVKNIKVGAAAAQGLLIKPGEEFSLVKTLGDVTKETGYFPELVIKGNKTVPEYGGGLCQIGTTIFRAALASGLPITSRQNHSYRVSYYEPAGTDAAIYIPNPDVRFVNDTANYILIQVRIVKTKIYFDFWGTSDGRIATTTTPVIYNITKPSPTKLIETPDLALGVKKCTEKAHNGADAYFDYKVIYPAGATSTPIKERRFKSHYVPWQEVCLIGTGAASSTPIKASSSAVIINTSSSTKPTNN